MDKKNITNKQLHHKPDKSIWAIFLFTVMLFIITILSLIFYVQTTRKFSAEISSASQYKEHIAFVGNPNNTFAKEVYEAAYKTGQDYFYNVEFFGQNLDKVYSNTELMEMAIAAKVDGIIVTADNSEEMTKQIFQANEAGIPVICVDTDCVGSARKSYVGGSYYNLGQEYGKLLAKRTSDEVKDVLVLMSPFEQSKGQNLIFSGIKDYLTKTNVLPYFNITTRSVGNGTSFSAEESVSDIFAQEELPDIIVCLDETNTTSACQCIVDYNKVGQVTIFGYYNNSTINNAILKDVIPATLTIDTKQVGKTSVEYLKQFQDTGYVNEYATIPFELITKDNVEQFMKEDAHE